MNCLNKYPILYGFFLIILGSCNKYSDCNQVMGICSEGNAPFCLYGFDFKKNKGNPGENATTQISYSFYSAGNPISTHSENNLKSQDFDILLPCAKKEIKRALNSFEGVANIAFIELEDNKHADIQFFLADMGKKRSAVSFPNFTTSPCKDIAGTIIINFKNTRL
jgi:hypothetical protein